MGMMLIVWCEGALVYNCTCHLSVNVVLKVSLLNPYHTGVNVQEEL